MVSIVLVVLCFLNQVANFSLQEAESGVAPSDLQVFLRGHRGSNPEAPDELCSQASSASLVSTVLKILSMATKFCLKPLFHHYLHAGGIWTGDDSAPR